MRRAFGERHLGFAHGYYFVASELATLSSAIFIAVPFVAGLTIGLLVNNIKHIALSGLGGCVFTMSFFIVMGMEGIFCALMAAPQPSLR